MRVLVLVFALMITKNTFAEIYKWVDEYGVTHYSERAPVGIKVKSIKFENEDKNFKEEVDKTDETQKLSKGLTNLIMKDYGNAEELDCQKAVDNGNYSLDVMQENIRRSLKNGYITREKYEKGSAAFDELRITLATDKCENSSDEWKKYYLCLTNSMNTIFSCANKYLK
ncbi:DUF4124 domain-containing protein [Zooshikella harenae]|uniref:DUF4124 domain-containing protein n=1 Tax=Zooshikella harenae TaxID=2827238 RepID=A0ABS5ZIQ0_9GAMM|nr:DUF4124 domain-containing protein [Zooshikella harenae]MBU2713658.1 DUF4124 domain-containing protein [Zooshikella harenae]